MKNKAPLPLMEQLIMILVFALTSVMCLQGFTLADRISKRQQTKNQAVVYVQNTAELLKHYAGDYLLISEQTGAAWNGHSWTISYDTSWQKVSDSSVAEYHLQITPLDTDTPLLGSALVQIFDQEDLLFEITVGWQEVDTHEIQ